MMCIHRALAVLPRRAMASSAVGKPPSKTTTSTTTTTTTTDTTTSSSGASKINDDHKEVTKTEQKKQFVNYTHDAGYKPDPNSFDNYLNPLLTPPPRAPSTPEDFRHPDRLGHWRPLGFDYTSPVADRYKMHELLATMFIGLAITAFIWNHWPDFKLREWAKREAFLRTAKREALGLPLIDRNVVDPERVVLPTEEEIDGYPVHL